MTYTRRDWRDGEGGMVSVQYVVASAFTMVLLVLAVNLVVDLYAIGAIRDALDEGTRAGAPFGASSADCERKVREVLNELLPGSLGADTRIGCATENGVVVANAHGRLRSWVPQIIPDWSFSEEALAVKER